MQLLRLIEELLGDGTEVEAEVSSLVDFVDLLALDHGHRRRLPVI